MLLRQEERIEHLRRNTQRRRGKCEWIIEWNRKIHHVYVVVGGMTLQS